jgi:hypothetical protein
VSQDNSILLEFIKLFSTVVENFGLADLVQDRLLRFFGTGEMTTFSNLAFFEWQVSSLCCFSVLYSNSMIFVRKLKIKVYDTLLYNDRRNSGN